MSAAQVALPVVSVEIADAGQSKQTGEPLKNEGQHPNRSRFKVTIRGAGTYYWTPAEAEAIFQALGQVLEPLGGSEEKP